VEALISSDELPNPKGRKEQIRSTFYGGFLEMMAEFMASVCQVVLPSQYITISLLDRRLKSPDLVAFLRVSVITQNSKITMEIAKRVTLFCTYTIN
jgi:hypothetical protein